MGQQPEELLHQALAVLRRNRGAGYTRPAREQYPHQWSWDSAFICIGLAHADPEWGWREMAHLFSAQWANGMVPHIVFTPGVEGYFPGPERWQAQRAAQAPPHAATSGICQPPLHATAVLHLLEHDPDREQARDRAIALYPKLLAWHRFLYRERNPDGSGLAVIVHPWESGFDNSPQWDDLLACIHVPPGAVPPFKRLDTQHVAADERPSNAHYQRFLYLVEQFKGMGYGQERMARESPFRVQGIMVNAILSRANRDLAALAAALGEDSREAEQWAKHTGTAINRLLWDPDRGRYFSRDLVTGELIRKETLVSFAPLYSGDATHAQARQLYAALNSSGFCRLGETCYALPNYDKNRHDYQPANYWRGPIWINTNWLLWRGLVRYAFAEYSEYVRHSIVELVQRAGFREYFDPEGGGHGAQDFSWTAALYIDALRGSESHGPNPRPSLECE